MVIFASGATKQVVMRLDPRIHPLWKKCFFRRWIAGSSPAMTRDCGSGRKQSPHSFFPSFATSSSRGGASAGRSAGISGAICGSGS